MKKFITLLYAALSMMGCCTTHKGIKNSDVTAFDAALQQSGIQLLDVRTAEEFADGHLVGAQNIDVLKDNFTNKAIATFDKSKTIYVYCRSGKRSMKAARTLAQHGYTVVNLNGGILAWQQSGKPITKGTNNEIPYNELHNYYLRDNNIIPDVQKIKSQTAFDKLFGCAAVKGKNGEPTRVDFEQQFVIAKLFPITDQATEIAPCHLTMAGDTLLLTYTRVQGMQQSWSMQPFLAIAVDLKYFNKKLIIKEE